MDLDDIPAGDDIASREVLQGDATRWAELFGVEFHQIAPVQEDHALPGGARSLAARVMSRGVAPPGRPRVHSTIRSPQPGLVAALPLG